MVTGQIEERTCAACGRPFTTSIAFATGRPRKFCEECHPSGSYQRVTSSSPRECERCGKTFTPKRSSRWCSSACKYRSRDASADLGDVLTGECRLCGKAFSYTYRGGRRWRYCSDECAAEAARRSAAAANEHRQHSSALPLCVICGGIVRGRRRKTCSDACREELHRRTKHAYRVAQKAGRDA